MIFRQLFTKISIVSIILLNSFYNVVFCEYPSDSTNYSQLMEYITYIADFNHDRVQDTLMSYIKLNNHSFPTSIHWGKSTVDSIQRVGIFKYPSWNLIDARITVDDFDNDSTSDMIVYLWGNIKIDSNIKLDTGKILLIWGQYGLDSLGSINIDSIIGLPQEIPSSFNNNENITNNDFNRYKLEAKSLKVGYEIINPKINNRKNSANFQLNIPKRTSKKKIKNETSLPKNEDKSGVNISPNPTTGLINLEITNFKFGLYKLVVFDNNAKKVYREEFNIDSDLIFYKNIDLSFLTNGSYQIVIFDNKQIHLSYKFLILK